MKKQLLLGSFLALAEITHAQNVFPTPSGNVGIGLPALASAIYPLDVRGHSTFGFGIAAPFFGWTPTGNQRGIILCGDSAGGSTGNGFASYWALTGSDPSMANQILGVYGFGHSRKGLTTGSAGAKAAIAGYATGSGGSASGFGGSMLFLTSGDNNGVVTAERMRLDHNGYLGIGITAPTEQLHTSGGVRFQGLTTGGSNLSSVGIDSNGKLWINSSAGISNACTTTDIIPKSTSTGNLTCSQIYDDGTSVGIATTSGFAYTWTSGLSGTPAPPASGTVKLAINGVTSALAYFATSDERFKKDIRPIGHALSTISQLNGKTYIWRSEEFKDRNFNNARQYGFIAQELEKVMPEAVATNEQGYKSVSYDMIIPVLTEGIKEQQQQIEAQAKENADLKSQLADLQKQVSELKNANASNATGINQLSGATDGFALEQNVPNPFSQETVINYHLPNQVSTASLLIYDLTGKQITSFVLNSQASAITITSEKLAAGVYIYSVMADGKILDSKRMVVAQK